MRRCGGNHVNAMAWAAWRAQRPHGCGGWGVTPRRRSERAHLFPSRYDPADSVLTRVPHGRRCNCISMIRAPNTTIYRIVPSHPPPALPIPCQAVHRLSQRLSRLWGRQPGRGRAARTTRSSGVGRGSLQDRNPPPNERSASHPPTPNQTRIKTWGLARTIPPHLLNQTNTPLLFFSDPPPPPFLGPQHLCPCPRFPWFFERTACSSPSIPWPLPAPFIALSSLFLLVHTG